MDISLPVELTIKVKLDCGQVSCCWPLCQLTNICLTPREQKLLARRFRFSNRQLSALRGCRNNRKSSSKHYIFNHLKVVAVISSGIGPQDKFQWFIYFPSSFLRIFNMRERKSVGTWRKRYTSWVWVWDLLANGNVTLWKYRTFALVTL